jgi:hypothetical protein
LPRSILGQDPANICNFQQKEGKNLAKAEETPRFSKSEGKSSLFKKRRKNLGFPKAKKK